MVKFLKRDDNIKWATVQFRTHILRFTFRAKKIEQRPEAGITKSAEML
jgi:hypothetical protein